MAAFLAGFGITVATLFAIFGTIVAFSWIIAVIRIAINRDLGSFSKIVWILLSFVPVFPFLYFAFVDRNILLKLVGWGVLIAVLVAALSGGQFLHKEFSFTTIPEKNAGHPAQKPQSRDDSGTSL